MAALDLKKFAKKYPDLTDWEPLIKRRELKGQLLALISTDEPTPVIQTELAKMEKECSTELILSILSDEVSNIMEAKKTKSFFEAAFLQFGGEKSRLNLAKPDRTFKDVSDLALLLGIIRFSQSGNIVVPLLKEKPELVQLNDPSVAEQWAFLISREQALFDLKANELAAYGEGYRALIPNTTRGFLSDMTLEAKCIDFFTKYPPRAEMLPMLAERLDIRLRGSDFPEWKTITKDLINAFKAHPLAQEIADKTIQSGGHKIASLWKPIYERASREALNISFNRNLGYEDINIALYTGAGWKPTADHWGSLASEIYGDDNDDKLSRRYDCISEISKMGFYPPAKLIDGLASVMEDMETKEKKSIWENWVQAGLNIFEIVDVRKTKIALDYSPGPEQILEIVAKKAMAKKTLVTDQPVTPLESDIDLR